MKEYDLGNVHWIEVLSSDQSDLDALGLKYSIHPLAIEDCLHSNQRAKFDDFENHQLLVWFAYLDDRNYEFELLIFPNVVILVTQEKPPKGEWWFNFLQMTANHRDGFHLVHSILDRMMDATSENVRHLFSSLEEFEQRIFSEATDPRDLLSLKRELAKIEFMLAPLASVAGQMLRFLTPKDDLRWKIRDLVDHSERVHQSLVFYRQQVASTMETYWGFSSRRVNDRIKKLTLLASVSVPLTFWCSFWGMNFEILPFKSPVAFMVAMGLMLLSGFVIFLILRNKGYWE